jgi:uncharacterized membrane protein
MLSSWYPVDSIDNLRINTLCDGIFHGADRHGRLFALAGG